MEKNFHEKIAEVLRNRPMLYKAVTLDLSVARNDVELPIAGSYFYVKEATDLNTYVDIKFNTKSAYALTFNKREGLKKLLFHTFFITNAAQAGKSITFIVGVDDSQVELIDKSSTTEIQNITDPVLVHPAGITQYLNYEWTVPASSGYYDTGVYTVPAGKRATLAQYSAYVDNTTSVGQLSIKVRVNTDNIDFISSESTPQRLSVGKTDIKLVAGDVAKFTVSNNDSTARLVRGSMVLNEYDI